VNPDGEAEAFKRCSHICTDSFPLEHLSLSYSKARVSSALFKGALTYIALYIFTLSSGEYRLSLSSKLASEQLDASIAIKF
jgi:hypothetical protein